MRHALFEIYFSKIVFRGQNVKTGDAILQPQRRSIRS